MVKSLRVSCGHIYSSAKTLLLATVAMGSLCCPAAAVVFIGDKEPAAEMRASQPSLPTLPSSKHVGDMRFAPKALLQAGTNLPPAGYSDSKVVPAGYTQSARPVVTPQQAAAMQKRAQQSGGRSRDLNLRPTASANSAKPSFFRRLFGGAKSEPQLASKPASSKPTTGGGVQQARFNSGRSRTSSQPSGVRQASGQQRSVAPPQLTRSRGTQNRRPGGIANTGSHKPAGLFSNFGKKRSQPRQTQVASTKQRTSKLAKQSDRSPSGASSKKNAAGRLSLLAKQTEKTPSSRGPQNARTAQPRKSPFREKLVAKPSGSLKSNSKPSDGVVFVSDESSKTSGPAINKGSIISSVKPAPAVTINKHVSQQVASSNDSNEGFFVSDLPQASDSAPKAKQDQVAKVASLPAGEIVELKEAPQPMPYPETSEQSFASVDTPAKPLALPNPVAPRGTDEAPTQRAVAILADANQFAATAETEEEFTQLVQRCRHVLAIDRSQAAIDYSNQLASWALNKRGELRADAGSEEEAVVDFQDAIRMNGQCWRAVHNLGVLHAQAGRFAEAFDAFNATIDMNDQFAKAYSNRASLYVQAGDFQAALDDYQQAISVDPDLAIAHKGRGRVCHMLGRMQAALQHLDAAALLDPNDASTATCRADLLVDMGRYAAAKLGYHKAIELDPELPNAYRNLAWLQATCPDERFRNGEQAVLNAGHALELLGEEDDISLDTLAAAQAATGDFEVAIETLKRAIELAPASDDQVYDERLSLYKEGKPFRIAPVDQVQQAGYLQ